ncbi:MAG: hypothetical protein H6659_14490 [Ardenticatenaceae bacterium]|nr:hypothetical protein [Ardenticatenaceae bacterium]MCB8986798.1 hypothetical protein [Ardenticatenaceae bacterium]
MVSLLLLAGTWGWSSRAVRPAVAQEPTVTPTGETAVDPRFGVVEAFWEPAEAADLQVGWDRILFLWHEIQPTGPDDWNTLHVLEEWLVDAQAHGRTIVGLLKSTPPWAAESEPYAGVPRGLYLPIDDPDNLWAVYVRKVAEYYGARGVHDWVVWNEPDIAANVYGHEFGGSLDDYYRLVQVAYLVMKDADPQAVIHLGALTYWHDPSFLRRYLELVTADPEAADHNYYFDVLSLHIYFRPETIPDIINEAYDLQRELGIEPPKPVWMNETNARPSLDPDWPVEVQQFHLDLEQQAWYVPQAFALAFAAGAERASFYKLIDIHLPPGGESWGLLRPDKSPRPAYRAYQVMVQELGGFEGPVTMQETAVLSNTRQSAYTQVTFPMPDGVVRVLWARGQSALTVAVPALAASGELVGYMGHREAVTAVDGAYTITLEGGKCTQNDCDIGGPPVYLVERGPVLEATVPPVNTPLAVATITATPEVPDTPTPVDTPSPTPSSTPTITPTPTQTATATATQTATPSRTPSATPSPTVTEAAAGGDGQTAVVTGSPALEQTEAPSSFVWLAVVGMVIFFLIGLVVWRRRHGS